MYIALQSSGLQGDRCSHLLHESTTTGDPEKYQETKGLVEHQGQPDNSNSTEEHDGDRDSLFTLSLTAPTLFESSYT